MRGQSKATALAAPPSCLQAAVITFLAAGSILAVWRPVHGQPLGLVAGVESDGTQGQHPFLLPQQPPDIGEAIEDFRRFAGRKQWEKAFKHLQKVFEAQSTGLVLTDSGIMLPSRLIAREALLELPPAGQDAYRIFFDAEAKKLLEQAQGTEELTKLTQIFTRYLVTSVGDEAANRLGDLQFEAGNFAQAVNAWQSILEERPDSKIPKAKLRVKIAVGLARLQRWGEFRQLFRVIEQQHPQDKLTIAGKEVSPAEYLQPYLDRSQPNAAQLAATGRALPPDIPLSGNPEPLWQFRFFPHHDPVKDNQAPGLRMQQNWGWGGGGGGVSEVVPPIAADSDRVYVNFVGYALGIDQQTGKLLFRSGRFLDAIQKAQQGQLQSVEQFALALGSDRTWNIANDPAANNQQQGMRFRGGGNAGGFSLWARELGTGKELLASKNITELKEWNLRGSPLVTPDRIFVCASKPQQQGELHVLALNPKDARMLWSTQVGTYVNEQQNYYYYQPQRSTQPTLIVEGDRLYVDTNAGSLVQIEVASGQVDWGLNYSSDPQQNRDIWWGPWGPMNRSDRLTVSPPLMVNGILYVKGMRSRRLYAIDPQRPKVLWTRPVPKSATVLAVDDERFYLGGEEISAYDAGTRKILWSANIVPGTSWNQPLVTQNRIYSFSPRGIYEVDKATGQLVHLLRGSDQYSLGGVLIVAPKCLLAVSNLAITAYPLPTAPATAASDGDPLAIAYRLPGELRATWTKELRP